MIYTPGTLLVVQLLLESLPVSSSGHIQLLRDLLHRYMPPQKKEKKKQIHGILDEEQELLHIPTGLVVSLFLGMRLLDGSLMLHDLMKLIPSLLVTTSVTGVLYIVMSFARRALSLPYGFLITTTLLGMLLYMPMISPLMRYVDLSDQMGLFQAALLGLVQGLALQPGISRLATTYCVGLLLGLAAQESFLYSLIAELLLVGAAVAKYSYTIYKNRQVATDDYVQLYQYSWQQRIGGGILLLCILASSYWLLDLCWNLALQGLMGYFGYYMVLPTIISFWYYGSAIVVAKMNSA